MAKTVRVDDVIQALVGEGKIVTGWVAFAEVVTSKDEYEIVVMTDGTSSPWKLEGLVNYALANGYLTLPDSSEDDVEFDDDDEDGE